MHLGNDIASCGNNTRSQSLDQSLAFHAHQTCDGFGHAWSCQCSRFIVFFRCSKFQIALKMQSLEKARPQDGYCAYQMQYGCQDVPHRVDILRFEGGYGFQGRLHLLEIGSIIDRINLQQWSLLCSYEVRTNWKSMLFSLRILYIYARPLFFTHFKGTSNRTLRKHEEKSKNLHLSHFGSPFHYFEPSMSSATQTEVARAQTFKHIVHCPELNCHIKEWPRKSSPSVSHSFLSKCDCVLAQGEIGGKYNRRWCLHRNTIAFRPMALSST